MTMKRAFDFLVSMVALVLLLPGLLLLAGLVCWRLGRPVIFRQRRPGLDGRIFEACKFRTMTETRDAAGQLLPDAVRLTSFGR